jgi:hypothetical protein
MAISKVKPLAAAALMLLSGVARAEATLSIFGDVTPQTAVFGDNLILNPAGPGALALSGTTRNVTITATSETSASEHKR